MKHTRTQLISLLLVSLMTLGGAIVSTGCVGSASTESSQQNGEEKDVAETETESTKEAERSAGGSPEKSAESVASAIPEQIVDLDLARRALVMGNSDYEAGPLANPENDARVPGCGIGI